MLVSLLIPCFNAERWIGQAIESALGQTHADTEVVVIDDGSTDGSLAAIQRFGKAVRWETGPNRGGNAARNRLLEMASGEWLQYLDADDYLLPDKVHSQLSWLSRDPSAEIIYSPALFEEWLDGRPTPLQIFPLPEPHDPWIHLGRWRLPQTGGTLWKKSAIKRAGGWAEHLRCCQEHELYFRLLKAGARFSHCPHGGAVYRYWPGDTISRKDPTGLNAIRLGILNDVAEHLRLSGQHTSARARAINITRFEIARTTWPDDRSKALAIMGQVMAAEPAFLPGGPAASLLYVAAYRLFGFDGAERIAALARAHAPAQLSR